MPATQEESYQAIETRRVEKAKQIRSLQTKFEERSKGGGEYASDAEMTEYRAAVEEHKQLRAAADHAREVETLSRNQDLETEFRTDQVRRARTGEGLPEDQDDEVRRRSAGGVVDLRESRSALTLRAWFRAQAGVEPSKEEREACQALGFNPARRDAVAQLSTSESFRELQRNPERRALSVGTTTAGGFTVPAGFLYELDKAMLYFGPMLRAARVLRTESGNSMPMPEVTDIANTGELLAENTTVGSAVEPTFAAPTLGAYKFSSKLVLISAELLEDSAFDVSTEVAQLLGERLGRVLNAYATTGTNSGQPQGVANAATSGKVAASATAITLDEVINLQHSVDIAYRANAAWMMHDAICEALSLLKDGDERYQWQPSIVEGQPDKLRGAAVWINNHMASSMAANARVILYGDFSKFVIRQVREIRMRRLVERYGDLDQEGFVGFLRADSKLRNAAAGPIKRLTMAAS